MASVFQCDTCGRIMKRHVDGGIRLTHYDTLNNKLYVTENYDLCEDCYNHIMDYLRSDYFRSMMCRNNSETISGCRE